MMPPCKPNGIPCPKREIGCHGRCKEYLMYVEERKAISDARELRNALDTMTIQGINRIKHIKYRKKRR